MTRTKVSKKGRHSIKSPGTAQSDDFKAGSKLCKQAIRIDNRFEDAFLSLAGMYQELKDYQQAIFNFRKSKGYR